MGQSLPECYREDQGYRTSDMVAMGLFLMVASQEWFELLDRSS